MLLYTSGLVDRCPIFLSLRCLSRFSEYVLLMLLTFMLILHFLYKRFYDIVHPKNKMNEYVINKPEQAIEIHRIRTENRTPDQAKSTCGQKFACSVGLDVWLGIKIYVHT